MIYDDYQDDGGDQTYVYKVDREMEYRRPPVILQVGDSNELYRPGNKDSWPNRNLEPYFLRDNSMSLKAHGSCFP